MPSAPDLPAERPRFLVATFHYVGMPETPFAGIHGLSGDQFRAAVTKLAEAWNVVSLADLRRYLSADAPLPDRCCLITFDDGLRCQFEVALPILEDLSLPAVFFVMGAPYARNAAAIVHKLHYIRAYAGDAAVTEAIKQNAGAPRRNGHRSHRRG